MFPLIAMLIFVLIALLGLFHVLIVKATAWGFVAWFVALVIYNMTRKEGAESKEENIIPPVGLGGYVSDPPQGCDATIPVISPKETQGGGQSNSALLRLMSYCEREINARMERAGESGPSDARYEEPQASYPMEMEQEL